MSQKTSLLIEEKDLRILLMNILQKGKQRIVAPLRGYDGGDGGGDDNLKYFFREVHSQEEIAQLPLAQFDKLQTHISPKEFFFPRYAPVLKYQTISSTEVKLSDVSADAFGNVDNAGNAKETIILGLHPCDAVGLSLLDRVFTWDYDDNFYLKPRESTTLLTFACSKIGAHCFCTGVGGAPDEQRGSDLLFSRMHVGSGDGFHISVLTPKGERLVAEHLSHLSSVAVAPPTIAPAERSVIDLLDRKESLKSMFDSSLLVQQTYSCLGCGVCAMVCPTCHCFDIIDEDHPGSIGVGERMKIWDACSFALFSKHGGGHNPRDLQCKRCRQRYFHKLVYYPEKFSERSLCVGCGRCARACPVGLDIYSAVTSVTSATSAVSAAAIEGGTNGNR
ncbi:MAG: 4Fe-4S dicluster domain-containing protein [Oligoflexia bacterium]|nr:4Fe-4S dicluster domain-containing protein [Oligoflexia bacterium]